MSNTSRPKIGLFSGGMEQYWKDCGMDELPAALKKDILKLNRRLEKGCDVVYPLFVENEADSKKAGKSFLKNDVDMVLMYHANYIDDAMSVTMIEELKGIFTVLFLSQGFADIPSSFSLIDAGRTWGVNSAAQLPSSLQRLWPDYNFGFVFGHIENDRAISEIISYAKAARCVKNLKGKLIGIFPHRSAAAPMYDTFPDESRMMGQTGIRLTYLYIKELLDRMEEVSNSDVERLTEELYEEYDVVEPPKEEISLAAKQSLALEKLVEEKQLDSLAIDTGPGMIPMCGMIPCVGMARLIDKGIVVTTEGDLSVAVSGLIIKGLCGKPIHFWENLMFDEGKNWVLGGHEGGSAGFTMAKKGTRPKLRNTQYVDFGKIPGAPFNGVIPEFITSPGPVNLLTMFRAESGYEMRLARGESVDSPPFEIHYEHTIFKPNVSLNHYFNRIAEVKICHHFALVHAEISREIEKVAKILKMKLEYLTE
jgi:L-fucose isomerase-like protein